MQVWELECDLSQSNNPGKSEGLSYTTTWIYLLLVRMRAVLVDDGEEGYSSSIKQVYPAL